MPNLITLDTWSKVTDNPSVIDTSLAIGMLAGWVLMDHTSSNPSSVMCMLAKSGFGKTIKAQQLYRDCLKLRNEGLRVPIPFYFNFSCIRPVAMSREGDRDRNKPPLTLAELAIIEVIRLEYRKSSENVNGFSLYDLNMFLSQNESVVILDNFEMMFHQMSWGEDEKRQMVTSLISFFLDTGARFKPKILITSRPETHNLVSSVLEQRSVRPLVLILQDYKKARQNKGI